MKWGDKTVLITGGGGFIGSHLTETLASLGAKTRAFIRYNSNNSRGWLDHSPTAKEIEIILGDIRDRDSINRAMKGVDVVFHLAALIAIPYSYNAPMSYVRTNVEGTLNILQASMDSNVDLLIHTSTSEVYGTSKHLPISEDSPLQGQSPYSASKIGADKLAESFYRSFGLPITTVRPFNTYGPRQSARAVIPTIVTQALTASEIHIGSLEPTRDFNYVSDTVQGFIKAAESSNTLGDVFNIGSGTETSIGDLASAVLNALNIDIPIIRDDKRERPDKSEIERLCADNRKAHNILGWSSKYRLQEGLEPTIEWIKENLQNYRTGDYII